MGRLDDRDGTASGRNVGDNGLTGPAPYPRLKDVAGPFVLLDDARMSGAASSARLYRNPVSIVVTRRGEDIALGLAALRTATEGGLHCAGFLSYEAGAGLDGSARAQVDVPADALPLFWFGLFRDYECIPPEAVSTLLEAEAGGWLGVPDPEYGVGEYEKAFTEIQDRIRAGDLYQANLTFRAHVAMAGHPLALYAGLRRRAQAGYGGLVHTGGHWLLSLSPELFFASDGRKLLARPMKGTAPRSADADVDADRARALGADPKQRAENLMIVDLLRNDLTRVAQPGSVNVPNLFAVETYPTVHQMTSTITATLADTADMVDAMVALFPCGSVTGTPKHAAMNVIDAIETTPRGIYTGAIGRIDAGGRIGAFNVAIRTLHLVDGADKAVIGLGSGIVADSNLKDEWQECLTKGMFVPSGTNFDLIETMAFDPLEGIGRLDHHLERLKASADRFGFVFDRHKARNELQAATFRLRTPACVRLMLAPSGAIAIATCAIPATPDAPVAVGLTRRLVAARDFRLAHKTSDRSVYRCPQPAGHPPVFDWLFLDDDGFLTEGRFTSLFVPDAKGQFITPPLSRGVLPGLLRAELLASGQAREGDLRAEDLSGQFFLGNALRGLVAARLVGL